MHSVLAKQVMRRASPVPIGGDVGATIDLMFELSVRKLALEDPSDRVPVVEAPGGTKAVFVNGVFEPAVNSLVSIRVEQSDGTQLQFMLFVVDVGEISFYAHVYSRDARDDSIPLRFMRCPSNDHRGRVAGGWRLVSPDPAGAIYYLYERRGPKSLID